MPSKVLYNLALPNNAQTRSGSQVNRRVSKQGVLERDVGGVQAISLEPGQQLLEGQYRARYAPTMARQAEELFDAGGFEAVAFFRLDAETRQEGYYSLENADVRPQDPREERVQRIDGTLTHVGGRGSHFRSVSTGVDTVTNPFGSDTTRAVAVHGRADKTWWFDSSDGSLQQATVQTTREGFGPVSVAEFDVTEPTFSDPELVYDLPYRFDAEADLRVYDDYDRDRRDVQVTGSTTVGSAVVGTDTVATEKVVENTWQTCFRTDHEFRGTPIVDNGLLRLTFDEANQRLHAARWNELDEHYDAVQLGANSAWRLYDLHLTSIAPARVEAQVEFEDTSAGSLTTHNVDMVLRRGMTDALWTRPQNGSAIPATLQNRLSPIAETTDRDPGGAEGLRERSEVDR